MPRRFTALSHWITTDNPPLTAAPLTVALWYRPLSGTSTASLLVIGDKDAASNDHRFRLEATTTPSIRFSVATTSGTNLTSTGVLRIGEWNHCLGSANATYSPNRVALNGFVNTLTSGNRVPAGVDHLVIGVQRLTSSYTTTAGGDIFWPAVWNVQLTPEEEAALAAGMSPRMVRPQNLVFFVEQDDQRRIWRNDISGEQLLFSTGADTTQYVPDIPPQVAARLPRRKAKIYAFPAAGATGTLAASTRRNTLAASGTVNPITGTLAATTRRNTFDAVGDVTSDEAVGILDTTTRRNTMSADGVVNPVTGTFAAVTRRSIMLFSSVDSVHRRRFVRFRRFSKSA